MTAHLIFDLLAYLTTGSLVWLTVRCLGSSSRKLPDGYGLFYFMVATTGIVMGSVFFGSVNLYLMGVVPFLAKSVLGGIVGGVVAVELMKWHFKIRGSTGAVLVVGLCFGIAVGRVGCFYGGLEDQTYGIPTTGDILLGFPMEQLGVDFGDGLSRYPVQLFEAVSLALLGIVSVGLLKFRQQWMTTQGFYFFCGVYGLQRFFWEFLKPYPELVIGLNIFQLTCIGLVLYALLMAMRANPVNNQVSR